MAFRFRDLMGSVTLMENDVRRASDQGTQCASPSGTCDPDDDDQGDQGGTQCISPSGKCDRDDDDKSKHPKSKRLERQAAELVALQCQIRQLAAAASCPP
jgi:hypothetical protein